MFLIAILHLIGHGGILSSTSGTTNRVVDFLYVAAYCAVDIYALISGYVGYTQEPRPFKSKKVVSIWLQVFCYSFGIALGTFILKPEWVGLKELIQYAFPVSSFQYWYFSSYFVVLLLSPWINRFIRSLNKLQFTRVIIVMLVLFSGISIFGNKLGQFDPFRIIDGFSAAWLIILYFVGAWIKVRDITEKISSKWAWIIILLMVVATWALSKYIVLTSYVSPTIVLIAIMYIVIFSKLKVNKICKKIISFFAPAAFGVYLIHDNTIVRHMVITRFSGFISMNSAVVIVLEILLGAICILLVCMLVDKLRQWLFKVLRIDKLIEFLGMKIDDLARLFTAKLTNFIGSDS